MSRTKRLKRAAIAVALLAQAACAGGVTTATLDHAVFPTNAGGTRVLSPEGAIFFAAYTLGHDTRGQPANAALALAAVDYLAGDFYYSPRFVRIPAADKVRMMQGRGELRAALAIASGATSQQVVDGLVLAADGYQAGDAARVATALPPSVFTLGPDGTTRVLSDLPHLVSASAGAQGASQYLLSFRRNS